MAIGMNEHRAQWDAEILADAETIKADPKRLSAAKSAAERMAEEKREQANSMSKVAGRKKRASGSGTRKPKGDAKKVSFISTPQGNNTAFNVFQNISK